MKAAGGAIEYISKHELNLVANNRPHQVTCTCSFSRHAAAATFSKRRGTMPAKMPGTTESHTSSAYKHRLNLFHRKWGLSASASSRVEMKIWVVQGLVLDCSALAWEPLDQFPPADEAAAASVRLPVWLALDEIEDPVSSPYSPRRTSTR